MSPRVVERGLEILKRGEWLLGISEIADRLEMSRLTTHRYVSTLQVLGFLEQGDRRRYRLTLGVTKLGCSTMSGMGFVVQARALMEELADQTGLVADLGVLAAEREFAAGACTQCGFYELPVSPPTWRRLAGIWVNPFCPGVGRLKSQAVRGRHHS